MGRLLVFNDPHFTRTPPECRADSYPLEMLEKFMRLGEIAGKLQASIACTGDWFHRKGRVTYNESNDLLSALSTWRHLGISVYGILGNHDIAGHALDSMDNRAAGSLVHSKVLQLLDVSPAWIGDPHEPSEIYLTGTSYFHGCDANDESRVRMYGAPPARYLGLGTTQPNKKLRERYAAAVHVHLAHGCLLNKGDFFEEFTLAEELIPLLHEKGVLPDVIVCGHLHFPEGIYEYDHPEGGGRKVTVCRVGSLGQVASDDLVRTPQALVIATKGKTAILRTVDVGTPPVAAGPREKNDPRDPAEHEQRIKEFVRVLREEADSWSLADHGALLRGLAGKMGLTGAEGEAITEMVLSAVEKRQ